MLAMHVMLAAVHAANYRDAGNAHDVSKAIDAANPHDAGSAHDVSKAVDAANSHDAGNASNANAGGASIACAAMVLCKMLASQWL